jgi:hypothetical protein
MAHRDAYTIGPMSHPRQRKILSTTLFAVASERTLPMKVFVANQTDGTPYT